MPIPAYLVGLVGTGVTRSLTPPLHMAEGRANHLAYVYRPIDLTTLGWGPESLPKILDWAEALGFAALNITHPCKRRVITLLDRLDPTASALEAVNTVLFTDEGRIGYNTDTTGFEQAMRAGLPGAGLGRVLQLGAGGGGAAVADALVRLGVGHLTIVDLDPVRATDLAGRLASRHGDRVRISIASRPEPDAVSASEGIVNCTPQGMTGHPGSAIDPALLRSSSWVADIVYRPLRTELLGAAHERGCATLDGGGMAVFQAAEAFRLITGIRPDIDRMLGHFQRLVEEEAATPARDDEGVAS